MVSLNEIAFKEQPIRPVTYKTKATMESRVLIRSEGNKNVNVYNTRVGR